MTITTEEMTGIERMIAKMRTVADFLESHASVLNDWSYEAQSENESDYNKTTYVGVNDGYYLDFTVSGPDARELVKTLRREFGGKWEKQQNSYGTFRMTQTEREDGLLLRIEADGICEAKVVGQKIVNIPAVEASEARTEIQEVIEYTCRLNESDD